MRPVPWHDEHALPLLAARLPHAVAMLASLKCSSVMQPDHSRTSASDDPDGPASCCDPASAWAPVIGSLIHARLNTSDSEMTCRTACMIAALCNDRTTSTHNRHQEHPIRDLE